MDDSKEGEEAFNNLLNQVFYEFGTSKELQKVTEIKKRLIELHIEYLSSNDRSWLNDISIVTHELEEYIRNSTVTEVDYDAEVKELSKEFGIIDQKTTSIFTYYSNR